MDNVHAQMPSIFCLYAPARTVGNTDISWITALNLEMKVSKERMRNCQIYRTKTHLNVPHGGNN